MRDGGLRREERSGEQREAKLIRGSRKQKMADRQRVNGFARLYTAIRSIQHEVEDLMPEFEEQMESLL